MFWSCIGWCECCGLGWLPGCERLGWLLGRFWAIGAALDGWVVVVAVVLRLVKGRRGEAARSALNIEEYRDLAGSESLRK